MALPNFFIVGAPKAGTSALHAALAAHPQLYLSRVKEPKFYLCDGTPPLEGQRGPGDAHSAQEWVWRRDRYEDLFRPAPAGARRGESTPFYLYDRAAQLRIAADVPDARLVVVVRDPVERAYSNWSHLWSDGLEPVSSFVDACRLEPVRIQQGWAPFWHYLALGRYGEQLRSLLRLFPRDQIHVLRYRDLVDNGQGALDGICAFLGVEQGLVGAVPSENLRPFVAPSGRATVLGAAIRAGAGLGAHAPPEVWRAASWPLVRARQWRGGPRQPLAVADRRALVEHFVDDVELLASLTGEDFSDWLDDQGRGAFAARRGGQDSFIPAR